MPPPRKALVVTDIIETGRSLKPLVSALNSTNTPFDLVALDFSGSRAIERFLGSKILKPEGYARVFYGQRDFHGVRKETSSLFSKRYKDTWTQEANKEEAQGVLNDVRHDLRLISDELIKYYRTSLLEK